MDARLFSIDWRIIAILVLAATAAAAQEPNPKPAARIPLPFTISKETTILTEPIRENGFVDYAEALHRDQSKGITPQNNAAVALLRLMGTADIEAGCLPRLYQKLGIPPLPDNGQYFVSEARHASKLSESDPERESQFAEEMETAWVKPWKPKEFPEVERWIAINGIYLNGIAAACERPQFYSPVAVDNDDGSYSGMAPVVSIALLKIAKGMMTRAMRHLGAGATKPAMADAMTLHRLARRVASGKHLFDYFVAGKIERDAFHLDCSIGHHGKLTAAQVREFSAELAKLPPLAGVDDKLPSLLYMYNDIVAVIAEEGPGALQQITTGKEPKKRNLAVDFAFQKSIDWDLVLRTAREHYEKFRQAARSPKWTDRKSQAGKVLDDFKAEIEKESKDAVDWIAAALDAKARAKKSARGMAQVLFQKYFDLAMDGIEIEQRMTFLRDQTPIALAIAAYRADHGEYPETLAQLAPKYLAKIPLDPWTGKDLRFQFDETSYEIWAVGPNGEDDGGEEDDVKLVVF